MIFFTRLLRDMAEMLKWQEEDLSALFADIDDLKKWRQQMQITQEQVDKLAGEVSDLKNALDATVQRVQGVQGNLVTVSTEVDTLKQQLANVGTVFDSTALDQALSDATTEANSIAQAVTNAPVPVVPTPIGSDPVTLQQTS